jgi:hypothetical protein
MLHEAEADFKEELMRRMALLKVRDDDIFKQVLKEVEVDNEQTAGDIKHLVKKSKGVTKGCKKEEKG